MERKTRWHVNCAPRSHSVLGKKAGWWHTLAKMLMMVAIPRSPPPITDTLLLLVWLFCGTSPGYNKKKEEKTGFLHVSIHRHRPGGPPPTGRESPASSEPGLSDWLTRLDVGIDQSPLIWMEEMEASSFWGSSASVPPLDERGGSFWNWEAISASRDTTLDLGWPGRTQCLLYVVFISPFYLLYIKVLLVCAKTYKHAS